MVELSVETLKELVSYDFASGLFLWKRRDISYFNSSRVMNSWNSRHLGKELFKVNSHGYLVASINGKRVPAHRAVWAFHYGEWPLFDIDHINCDKADNRISNLREATKSQNQHNIGLKSSNTSGYKGVHLHKKTDKWRATIWLDSKKKHLGLFDTKEAAFSSYSKAASDMHGEFSNNGVSL